MSAQMTSYDTMAVEVSHVTKTFPVPRTWTEKLLRRSELALTAVNDVSFSIAPGETFSLVGESGCGKSTLAMMVSGIYRPTAGSIRLFGIDTATELVIGQKVIVHPIDLAGTRLSCGSGNRQAQVRVKVTHTRDQRSLSCT